MSTNNDTSPPVRLTWLALFGLILLILILLACLLALFQPSHFAAAGRFLSFPADAQGEIDTDNHSNTPTTTPVIGVSQATATMSSATPSPVVTMSSATPSPVVTTEPILTVAFNKGANAAITQKAYQGPVTITVKGSGQAKRQAFSDAFYIYTDGQGHATKPSRMPYFATLCINEKPASDFVRSIPAYSKTHIYTVILNAPGGQLTFGICDSGLFDNTGSLTITFA